jgi:hypothetical protein
MSIKLMSQVWTLELEHGQQIVLLAMADHADDDGARCYPSVSYLAWKTNYSERQVQRIMAQLQEDQIIKPIAHEQGGRGMATEYHIIIEKGVTKSPFSLAERVTSTTQKGDTAMAPQPSSTIKEPSWEPLDAVKSDGTQAKGNQNLSQTEPRLDEEPLAREKGDGTMDSAPAAPQSIEVFRERMAGAKHQGEKVAVLVDLVKAYCRFPPPNVGGRAAGLLKQAKWDGGLALQCLAQACVATRSGDVFNYATGILGNGGRPKDRPQSIEQRRRKMDEVAAARSGARKPIII